MLDRLMKMLCHDHQNLTKCSSTFIPKFSEKKQSVQRLIQRKQEDMCVINDPFSQTYSPASSKHYSQLIVALFYEILKRGDGRQKGQTDTHQV